MKREEPTFDSPFLETSVILSPMKNSKKTLFALFTCLILSPLAFAKPNGLIKKSFRPANYETPIEDLSQPYTANDKFFERWHSANVPVIEDKTWRLEIGGESAEKPFSLTYQQLLNDFPAVELAALTVCSGNRRSKFEPHVPGVQWGDGATGNALWKGVRLRDILNRAGLKKDVLEVVFDGADQPTLPGTPDFRKSIPIAKALDPDTLIAFAMNGEALPHEQGFPARIVVPGWTATYWVKKVISIEAISKPYEGYWMKTAYRQPLGKFPALEGNFPSQTTDKNTPVTEMIVNSLITKVSQQAGEVEVKGFAWDGGHGIKQVEVSSDNGKSWDKATLGKDMGKYAWRPFSFQFKAKKKAEYGILAKATNTLGQAQPNEATPNPPGYHHNAPQKFSLVIK